MTVRPARLLLLAFAWFLMTPGPSALVQAQRRVPQVVTADAMPVVFTKLETLLSTPNTLLIRDLYRIETRLTFGMTIDALVVTESGREHERLRGLRIELHDPLKPSERSVTTLVDYEEAVALSRALATMAELSAKWTGRDEQRASDLQFETAGGFRVVIHQTFRVQSAFLSAGLVDPIRRQVDIPDLATLRTVVEKALAVLADK